MTSSTYKELICPVGNNYCWPFDRANTNVLDTGNYYCTPGIEIDKNIWGRWLFNVKKITSVFTSVGWNGTSTNTTTVFRANPELITVYDDYGGEWTRIVGKWNEPLPPAINTFSFDYQTQKGELFGWQNYPLFCFGDDPYEDTADYANSAFFPYLYISGGKFKASSKGGPLATLNSINASSMVVTRFFPYGNPTDPGNNPNWYPEVTQTITVTIDETFF